MPSRSSREPVTTSGRPQYLPEWGPDSQGCLPPADDQTITTTENKRQAFSKLLSHGNRDASTKPSVCNGFRIYEKLLTRAEEAQAQEIGS